MAGIRLIVGLGNPGSEYEHTRHNVGAWYVERLAEQLHLSLRKERKYQGRIAALRHNGQEVHLLIPDTYMNRSGAAVAPLANFYKIPPEQILVAHDELDLLPGSARLKLGGGHGGHNGLRDIIAQLGNQNGFHRLRLGIGHPGDKSLVTGYVLGRPPREQLDLLNQAIDRSLDLTDGILAGDWPRTQQTLHTTS